MTDNLVPEQLKSGKKEIFRLLIEESQLLGTLLIY